MKKIDDIKFFQCDTTLLAKKLIGKWIKTTIDGEERLAQITETESYLGLNDSACHTYKGKRTARTEPMWQCGGTIYVYLCYGMHYLLNIVSQSNGVPEAVLIRACDCANGPAKLTKFLRIDDNFNNQLIVDNEKIAIFDDEKTYQFFETTRVGIDYAQDKDKNAKLRFVMKK